MNCKKCGMELKPTDKFCWACGTMVEVKAAAETNQQSQLQQPPVQEVPVQEPQVQQEPVWEAQPRPQEPVWEAQPQPQEPVWEAQPQPQEPVWEAQPRPQEPVWSAVEPPVEAAAWSQPVVAEPVKKAARPAKKKKKWLLPALIGGGVVVVAVTVLVLFLLGVFDSDKTKVMNAFQKSMDAFAEVGETMKIPDMSFVQEDQAYSMDLGFWINHLEDMEELNGLGIRGSADYSLSDEKMSLALTPFYGAANLIDVNLKFDGSMIYLGSPQLTGDTYYCINTETLGADINKLAAGLGEFEEFGFNIFELVKIMNEVTMSEEAQKKLNAAIVKLSEELEVEEVGSKEIEVNDHDVDCTQYEVKLSQEALEEFAEVLAEVMGEMNMVEAYEKMFETMNLPEEAMDEIYTMLERMDTDEMIEEIQGELMDMVELIGDIELDVYLDDGYIMAVSYEFEVDGTEIEIVLNIGGDDNYVDDLSLRITVEDDVEIVVASTGNHTVKGGKFTDTTTLSVESGSIKATFLTSEIEFRPSEKSDNFQWTIDMEEFGEIFIEVNGQITFGKKSADCCLDEISCMIGYDEYSFGLEYYIGEFKDRVKITDPVEVLKLSDRQMEKEIQKVGVNIQNWLMGLEKQVPELMEMLEDIEDLF